MVKFIGLFLASLLCITTISTIPASGIEKIRQEINKSNIIKDNAKHIVVFTLKNTEITETKIKALSQFWYIIENIKV